MRPQGLRPEEDPLLLFDDRFAEPSSDEYAVVIAGGGGSSTSSQKQTSWHPYIGVVLYLAFLGCFGITLLASWLGLLPTKFPPKDAFPGVVLAGLNVLLLAVTHGFQAYLFSHCKQQMRHGYLRFFQQMGGLLPLPFLVVSYGNCAVLGVVLWHPSQPAMAALHVVLALELATAGALVLFCTWLTFMHRSWHPRPDAYEELTSASRSAERGSAYNYGERQDLVERQAALIRFQQENLRQLSHEILRLEERLSKHSTFGGPEAGRQVAAAQLLAVREQEQQALAAEREQLQAELLRTHGMLGERQDEIGRLRDINQQYVDENARLRLMLDEWSARSAKLEIALDKQLRTADDLRNRLKAQDEHPS